MPKKKKLHPVLKILFALFIVYVSLYIASASGYYESRIRNKVTITDNNIKEFEEKIQNGEAINLDSYLENDIEDYSNKMSKLGDNLTLGIEKFATKGSKVVTDIIKTLF